MIKIVAKSVIKTEQIEKYLTLAKELVDKSRKEEGCISYSLFQDINDSSIFTFIEEWKDEKAINLHNNSEHFTRIVPLLDELRVGNGEVNLYKEI
ncbi:quinol monooxygenase YgiN [Clostridium beijerinckii]|uniref:putative quinol monooxygenase n=1 Tax=Clostridium beijerinckii TaxID=1520 RepID=UPI0015710863|nr:putative quinol monooxygenase [Clostridium beijerinckii]NRT37251.1 quinol monooxygenase YgiN [Clostridium beijerinckii]NRT43315.1 quinol monooxygenase YgiN [Clostridium beijerinckii]NRZ22695.1 quinol monooxygenase YgiN [Clostridium beijerinckii]